MALEGDPTQTTHTEQHRELVGSIHRGERTAKQAIAYAREQGWRVSKGWASTCRNADYMASFHRTFASTVNPENDA